MEVLNEKQQLQKRKEEIQTALRFQEQEIKEKKAQKAQLQSRFIRSDGAIRVIDYEISKMELVELMLKDYFHVISWRIRAIENTDTNIKQ